MRHKSIILTTAVICIASAIISSSVFRITETDEEVWQAYKQQRMLNTDYRAEVVTARAVSGSKPVTQNGPPSNHQHYAIRQSDPKWGSLALGKTTVSGGGCGFCSLIAALAELSGVCWTPQDFLAAFPSAYFDRNWIGRGMEHAAVPEFVAELNSKGKYGHYALIASVTGPTNECLKLVEQYAADKDKVVILSTGLDTSSCLFTDHRHIICCTDLSDDKKSFHISDSSGMSASKLGKSWDEMYKFDFPLYSGSDYCTSYGGYEYIIKNAWVIQKDG